MADGCDLRKRVRRKRKTTKAVRSDDALGGRLETRKIMETARCGIGDGEGDGNRRALG